MIIIIIELSKLKYLSSIDQLSSWLINSKIENLTLNFEPWAISDCYQ